MLAIAGSLAAEACGAATGVGLFDEVSADGGGQDATLDSAGDAGKSDSAPTKVDAPTDGGQLACGEASCREDEICFYPACGCVVAFEPMTDAGLCPDGSTFADVLSECIIPPHCQPPSCGSPGPDGTRLGCSGQNGSIPPYAIVPIPSGSSHICYADCA